MFRVNNVLAAEIHDDHPAYPKVSPQNVTYVGGL